MNSSGGLILIIVGLGILWLAVTGKLTKMLAALSSSATGNNSPQKIPGIVPDNTQVSPYGINPELGTPRIRPQYNPNTPVQGAPSSFLPSSSDSTGNAGNGWPLTNPLLFAMNS